MAKQKGISFVVKYDDTGGTPAVAAGARSGTLTINDEEIDITDKDGSGWKESLVGIKSWSVSSSGVMVDKASNTPLDVVEDAAIGGTMVDVEITDAAGKKFEGTGTVTSFEHNADVEDAELYTINISGTGALTKTDAS